MLLGGFFVAGPASNHPAPCPICGKVLSRSYLVNRHIKDVHWEVPYDQWETCELCQKKFKHKRYLQQHLISVHHVEYQAPTMAFPNP